jgi:hypothetical protein
MGDKGTVKSSFAILALALLPLAQAMASPVYYSDRGSFLASIGQSITDDYSGYAIPPDGNVVLSNAQMNSVLGEAEYQSISFENLNLVGHIYVYGDGGNYCAGCNGNFRTAFGNTSLTVNGGVFGVGVDIVYHTSRHTSIGDIDPGDRVVDGTVLVEFADASVEAVTIPADIGFFGPEVFFVGLTDPRGIKSLTFGTEPLPLRHSWTIDNLTIAAQIPEPATFALLGLGLVGVAASRRRRLI